MQDAAGGFRTYWSELVGTVTCWPSLLSMAATFDTAMMDSFATALGQGTAKGANTIFGVDRHRVARTGATSSTSAARILPRRVWPIAPCAGPVAGRDVGDEALCVQQPGDPPEFGVVVGRRQDGVGLYYPPFEAAVDAGIAGVMCSYNKVNGSFACADGNQLHRDLKTRMGFRGLVQSDWGAAHAMSIAEGLDEEMPIPEDFPLNKTPLPLLARQPAGQDLDVPAGDIIAALAKVGVLGGRLLHASL